MIQRTLQVENHDIRYEFRINLSLVIFTSLSDERLNVFAKLLESCSQIKQIEKLKQYDSGLSAIIVLMSNGYSEFIAAHEIDKSFKSLFSCQTTV